LFLILITLEVTLDIGEIDLKQMLITLVRVLILTVFVKLDIGILVAEVELGFLTFGIVIDYFVGL